MIGALRTKISNAHGGFQPQAAGRYFPKQRLNIGVRQRPGILLRESAQDLGNPFGPIKYRRFLIRRRRLLLLDLAYFQRALGTLIQQSQQLLVQRVDPFAQRL